MELINKECILKVDESEIKLFVGKNSDYYLHNWKYSEDPNKRAGWNWAAFFAGVFWLGYRRMYSLLLKFIGLSLVFDIIKYIIMDRSTYTSIGLGIALGLLGNSGYYRHMNKKIEKIKMDIQNPEIQKDKIVQEGGTSWAGVGITFLILLFYFAISTIIGANLR